MNAPQPTSPRRRLQELLAIPDGQRTDEEWDELNELEISLAPGNREGAPDPNLRRPTPSTGLGQQNRSRNQQRGGQPQQKAGGQKQPKPQQQPKPPAPIVAAKPAEEGQAKKPARKFRKRSSKPKTEAGPSSAPAAEGQ
ncbi:hypothetical protein [Azoarcus sp. KH32C]|uniref:hypothetical protein n=1 Tax=Azoarcus sp. KH32C TaxID=748247 RepID=UPI00023863C2|nr:hypothetical protein [Azoarcus sp. KH32C]BAL24123.1 hypothetical protein AZKH_1810 [Azoarcus sp. KH32C]